MARIKLIAALQLVLILPVIPILIVKETKYIYIHVNLIVKEKKKKRHVVPRLLALVLCVWFQF